MDQTGQDVILTGVPRSGTTLVCHLLNKLPNTIALHEPMRVTDLAVGHHDAAAAIVARFIDQTRATLRASGTAPSKHVDGRIPDGHVSDRPVPGGLRKDESAHGTVSFDKPLDTGFLLVIKHPSAFTALLAALARRFPCFAVIRNPLSILGSWNSVDMGYRDGHAHIAEQLDPALGPALGAAEDRLGRQLVLLSWFFRQYKEILPAGRILRYEQVVASGGASLGAVAPSAARLNEPLQNRNRSAAYDMAWLRSAGERLLASEGAYWHFYSRDGVEELLRA
jgi:hypothetical protein